MYQENPPSEELSNGEILKSQGFGYAIVNIEHR